MHTVCAVLEDSPLLRQGVVWTVPLINLNSCVAHHVTIGSLSFVHRVSAGVLSCTLFALS